MDKHGYTALQLGAGWPKPKNVNKPQTFHFRKHGVPVKRKLMDGVISS